MASTRAAVWLTRLDTESMEVTAASTRYCNSPSTSLADTCRTPMPPNASNVCFIMVWKPSDCFESSSTALPPTPPSRVAPSMLVSSSAPAGEWQCQGSDTHCQVLGQELDDELVESENCREK